MQKDLMAYQKLVKDQSECIESLHSTKSDDKKLLRSLQKENQRLKDQAKAHAIYQSRRANHLNIEQATPRNLVMNPALSSY